MRGNGVLYEWNKIPAKDNIHVFFKRVGLFYPTILVHCLSSQIPGTAYANNEKTLTWRRVYSVLGICYLLS